MPEIARVRYTHDAVIDEILVNPAISQNDLAKIFGFSPTWVSIIINSDAFQERLAERKGELVDPKIRATVNERLDAIASVALGKIMDRLDSPLSGQIKNVDLIAMAKLGVGDKNTRPAAPIQQNNLYVVALPPPSLNSSTWLDNAQRTPGPLPLVQEVPRG